ncbi:phage/plasmid primase, P4 family domain-containing protein [Allomyces macrogynus ATCC 38327]|uniref:Phage/plasmid primase, P4 family domain-containing protein n=1 Tax=Allomyces macrogynus (strain ATCC 38327) TaxID=578462 RepID=A0A0L0SG96_ALLM3|nr:phage/plasmid primase, P4 family domain-containing protein [Allomyces macrogynus ATCC 38327]|eukprot:KNE61536.1 phage/plasmid primase, P4 family domain-containing protein [Allomyces macrogynus ATCC 38327]
MGFLTQYKLKSEAGTQTHLWSVPKFRNKLLSIPKDQLETVYRRYVEYIARSGQDVTEDPAAGHNALVKKIHTMQMRFFLDIDYDADLFDKGILPCNETDLVATMQDLVKDTHVLMGDIIADQSLLHTRKVATRTLYTLHVHYPDVVCSKRTATRIRKALVQGLTKKDWWTQLMDHTHGDFMDAHVYSTGLQMLGSHKGLMNPRKAAEKKAKHLRLFSAESWSNVYRITHPDTFQHKTDLTLDDVMATSIFAEDAEQEVVSQDDLDSMFDLVSERQLEQLQNNPVPCTSGFTETVSWLCQCFNHVLDPSKGKIFPDVPLVQGSRQRKSRNYRPAAPHPTPAPALDLTSRDIVGSVTVMDDPYTSKDKRSAIRHEMAAFVAKFPESIKDLDQQPCDWVKSPMGYHVDLEQHWCAVCHETHADPQCAFNVVENGKMYISCVQRWYIVFPEDARYMQHTADLELLRSQTKKLNALIAQFKKIQMKERIVKDNDVYDLDTLQFCRGMLQDCVTHSCRYPLCKNSDPGLRQKLVRFIYDIQPHAPEREYMLTHLASCLHGDNLQEIFHIYTNQGRNGKSALADLLWATFGDYYSTIPAEMFTQERAGASAAQPELINLKGKRLEIASEPKALERINTAFVKLLTGSNEVSERRLYSGKIEEFRPQFQMTLLANEIPLMDSSDNAIYMWSRILEFPTTFVANPRLPHETMVKESLKAELPTLHNEFMLYLIDYYKDYVADGRKLRPPPSVLTLVEQHRYNSDPVQQFWVTRTEDDPEGSIQLKALYDTYKLWYSANFNGWPANVNVFHKQLEKLTLLATDVPTADGRGVSTLVRGRRFKDVLEDDY